MSDGDGLGDACDGGFDPNQEPTASAPAQGSVTSDFSPLMDWSDVPGNNVAYRLEISKDTSFAFPIVSETGITLSEFIPLLPNGELFWRVRAEDQFGNLGAFSQVRSFTVASAFNVNLLSPADGALITSTPSLAWTEAFAFFDPVTYDLQVSMDEGFSQLLVNETEIVSFSDPVFYSLPNLGEGDFFWRVQPVDVLVPRPFSVPFKFTVTSPPAVPRLLWPTVNATIDDPFPVFHWTDSVDADFASFTFQVASDAGFNTLLIDQPGMTESRFIVGSQTPLTAGATFWRVTAIDEVGIESTATGNFTIGLDVTPPLVQELIGAPGNPLADPVDLARGPSGNLVVVDRAGDAIFEFDPAGTLLLKWESTGSGDGQFQEPVAIALNATHAYVVDRSLHRIQQFDSARNFVARWGSVCKLDANNDGIFNDPTSGCIDPDGAGPLELGDGQFAFPEGISMDSSNNLYVSDGLNDRIQVFDASGNFVAKWSSTDTGGSAMDSADNLYVIGGFSVSKFNSGGTLLNQWGSVGSGDGQFRNTAGVAISPTGNVFVADFNNFRIQEFDPNGLFLDKFAVGERPNPNGVLVDTNEVFVAADTNVARYSFDVSAPGSPVTIAPSAAVVVNNDRPNFSWTAVFDPTGPVTYRLEVDETTKLRRGLLNWLSWISPGRISRRLSRFPMAATAGPFERWTAPEIPRRFREG